ncbi:MAG: 4'-phosphopantetheinyl transferase family protein [Salibacteraceae bacterium]
MIGIGNDIVDLNFAARESNWQRKGFLEKVFTYEEQNAIHNSNKPFELVWRLWSMKESAYKLYVQVKNERFFNPKSLICSILSDSQGTVKIGTRVFQTNTEYDKHYILTTALIDKSTKCISQHFNLITSTQSEQTHSFLLQFVAKQKQMELNYLTIQKTAINTPQLYYKNEPLPFGVSLTHHGNWGAFSISSFPEGKVSLSDGRGFTDSSALLLENDELIRL